MAKGTCSVDACERPVYAKGICDMHRWRQRKYGSFDLPQRRCAKCDAVLERSTTRAQRRVCDGCQGGTPQSNEYFRDRRRRIAGKINAQRRAAYALARSSAPCSDCGVPLPSNLFSRCAVCGEAHSKQMRQRRNSLAGRARRARLKGLRHEAYETTEIAERDRWRCQMCGLPVPKAAKHPDPQSASVDHIVPIVEGGHDVRANVQLAHLRCNLRKSSRTLPQGEQLRLIG